MRARHKPWADDYLKENQQLVPVDPVQYKGKWKEERTSHKPLHLEIGTGKGQFIAGMAEQYPDIHFVGMEVVKSIIVSAVERLSQTGLHNVTLLNQDAQDLSLLFADHEVDQLYLNFSDPWPKNRHAKRRLTYPSFLAQYQKILKPEGKLIFKTDNKHLFGYSLESFSQFGCILEEVCLDLHELADPTNVMTEYEEKFSSKGQPIYRCQVRFPVIP
ncbi:tRNA (guanosine(46)-N7)-methyltransferase TrmB [Gracilibacillus alcaliphilus]|uniref:tRNA (guanosine(46)-N7)-methyltransferase TrmB n=1 Tax=Gracilibacillus alcaliphilus TaxID=1401441 RepID=UPI0019583FAE|nr:tRNA (guanosine(46)-N7)-methyltransferase TrmB [Gracilibacillus alcaliphilus]MBM7679474.1 tRNA (guanine-N7-)-methyltransferase [Gracilibacillus alcaliphilus]